MGFRFRKSIKVLPGVKVNIGKKGISSVSLGGKGFTANVGKKGIRKTVSLKGTGLSHSSYQPYKKKAAPTRSRLSTATPVATPLTSSTANTTTGCICTHCSSMVYGTANIGKGMICNDCGKAFTVTYDGIQSFKLARIENMRSRARQINTNNQPMAIKVIKNVGIVIVGIIVFVLGFSLLLNFMANH